jgi:hypothetical protein
MNRLDLIIDALENAVHNIAGDDTEEKCIEALAAARELRELKPVGYIYTETDYLTQYKHLVGAINDQTLAVGTPLYALDEVVK